MPKKDVVYVVGIDPETNGISFTKEVNGKEVKEPGSEQEKKNGKQ